jgi:hypothetical protein
VDNLPAAFVKPLDDLKKHKIVFSHLPFPFYALISQHPPEIPLPPILG